jgi:hypothetical protein
MRSIIRHRPSPALVLSCIALITASVGGAHATSRTASKAPLFVVHKEYAEGTVGTGDVGTIKAHCQKGDYAISGGYQTTSGNFLDVVTATPFGYGDGYAVTVVVGTSLEGAAPAHIKVVAVCVKGS